MGFKKGHPSYYHIKGKFKYNFKCPNCNKEVHTASKKRKFCSLKCSHEYNWKKGIWKARTKGHKLSEVHKKKISESHKGEKSYLWKGGITPFIIQIRSCFEYEQWRLKIFQRDDWTCQICLKRGNVLEAHHIKEFSKIMGEHKIKTYEEAINCTELWDIDNGITLCTKCHLNIRRKNQMGEMNEVVKIFKNGEDSYEITRKTVELVNGDQLLKIYDQIEAALAEARKQLADIPKQVEERTKVYQAQETILKDRIEVFGHHVKKLKDLSKPVEKNPITQ